MWFELTLGLALTGTALILSFRAIHKDTNPFLFMTIVTAFSSCALFGYCLVTGTSLDLGSSAMRLALLAGVSVAVLDLAFIFMFRKGGLVSVAMPIFRVASIMTSAILGILLFAERLTPGKASGIVLACLAVYLLNSKPTKVEV